MIEDAYVNPNAGMDNLDVNDIVIGRRVLVQATSKAGTAGQFRDKETGEEFGTSMDVVVLAIRKVRTLFWDQKSGHKGLRCRSANLTTPDPRPNVDAEWCKEYDPPAPQCAGCPDNNICTQYEMTMLDVKQTQEFGSPVLFNFTFAKSNARSAKLFISAIKQRGKAPMEWRATIRSEKQTQKGVYYQAKFENVTLCDSNLKRDAKEAFDVFIAGSTAEYEPGASADAETEELQF